MLKHHLVVFFLILFFCSSLQAQEHSVANKVLRIGLGYLTGQATHEVGHYVVARSLGVNISPMWKGQTFPPLVYHLSPTSQKNNCLVAAGGFFAEYVASETILASSSLRTDDGDYDYFLIGWLLQTIICPIGYSVFTETIPNYGGDIDNLSYLDYKQRFQLCEGRIPRTNFKFYTLVEDKQQKLLQENRTKIEVFIVGHAVITAARMIFKLNDSDAFQISSTPNSVVMQYAF